MYMYGEIRQHSCRLRLTMMYEAVRGLQGSQAWHVIDDRVKSIQKHNSRYAMTSQA